MVIVTSLPVAWTSGGRTLFSGSDHPPTETPFPCGGVGNHTLVLADGGAICDSHETWLETEVVGAGTLTFYWKVSSKKNSDWLEFYIDDVRQDRIRGISGSWQQKRYSVRR